MSVRQTMGVAALSLLAALPAAADKLDKEAKQWLEDVQPLMLTDEERTYKDLKDKQERQEFQKIFWARRDPDLQTLPLNEFETEYRAMKAEVDAKYKVGGKAGSLTDCGRVHILMGAPDAVEKTANGQTWTVKDRKGITFPGGKLEVPFGIDCMVPQGSRFGEQLNRLAERYILHPELDYKRGADGKIVKLADQLPKPTPMLALLQAPRQDFTLTLDPKTVLRGPNGASYAIGLLKADMAAIGSPAEVVVGMLVREEGKGPITQERPVSGVEYAEGGAVLGYGMAVRAGKYDLTVGVLDPKSGKGSAATVPLEVPDYSTEELTASPILVLREVVENTPTPATHPMAPFAFGTTRFVPAFGNVFKPADSIQLISAYYNAKVDEASGKPSVNAFFAITDGKKNVKGDPPAYDTPIGTAGVGPVPLTSYTGKWTAKVKLVDNVSKKEVSYEAPFEVKP